MTRRQAFFLAAIVFLAGMLRLYRLGSNPPALTWDEAAWGYNAYSLGLTGRDEFGRLLPGNYLESFGDFKPPVYAYLAVLPVKLLGLNEFATRFPSALFGTATVLLTYFLVKELVLVTSGEKKYTGVYRSETLALTASLLLAISPWHIMLSRAAFEANVATFFLVAGVTFFLAGMRAKGWQLLIAAICLAFSLATFNTARVVAPILLLALLVVFRKKLWQKKFWLLTAAMVGLIICLPTITFLLSPQARLRFREVNIFSDAGVIEVANQEMSNDHWAWWSKLLHNRRWGYFRAYLSHYFDHFRPDFLFIRGDGNPKFSTRDVGQLYWWELPFIMIGVLFLIRKKPGLWWLVLFWLLVGIIPAATARETPHALRIETTLPTWQILTAFGIMIFWETVTRQKSLVKNSLRIIFCVLVFATFIYFQHGYWRHYPVEFSGEWQYGYKPLIQYIKEKENQYDQVWLTDRLGRPYIYLLYYARISPEEFQKQAVIERDSYGFVFIRSIGKYRFFRSGESLQPEKEALIVDLPDRIPEDEVIINTIRLLNGETVFGVYSNLPDQG